VRWPSVRWGGLWWLLHARVEGGGRESPGVRVTFFCVAKRKSPKKRRPPVCDPFASLRGDLRRGDCGVRRRTHFALARSVQTTAASQITRHARSDAHAHPATAPTQAQPAGVGSQTAKQPHGPLLRSASRSRREAPARSGPNAAQRNNGPNGCFSPSPSVCAEERSGRGEHVCRRTHMLRGLARRSCLNGAAKQRSEFCGAPCPRAPQVAPARSAGDADSGVAFSLVTFFLATQKKVTRMPGDSRPPHSAKARTKTSARL
jgi:hypothetical protein